MQREDRGVGPGSMARLAAVAILSTLAVPAAAAPPPLPSDLPVSLENPVEMQSAPASQPEGAPAEGGATEEAAPASSEARSPELRVATPAEQAGSFGLPPGRLGGLGLFDLLPPPGGRKQLGGGLSITPSVILQGLATDNLNVQSGRNRQADFVASVTPDIYVTADTPRLVGAVRYAPSFQYYTESSDHTRVLHRLNGQALAVLVPETLFLDLRGSSSVIPTTGTFATSEATAAQRLNSIQSTSLQASPYLFHRFGSLASVRLGYLLQYGEQSGNSAFLPNTSQPFFTGQHFVGQGGYFEARTGERFGRLALRALAEGTTYTGNGVLDGAHRTSAVLSGRYAIQRGVAVLLEGGYENQAFAGLPPVDITGPVWTVGLRLAPTPDSVIIVRYGRRNGFESPSASADLRLTPRTRLTGLYYEVLSTSALAATDLLSSTTLDDLGNPVDATTGAPLLGITSGGLLAAQSSLQRIKSGVVRLTHEWPRDSVSLSVNYQETRPISIVAGTTAFQQRGTAGGIGWSHNYSPQLNGTVFLQYGQTEGGNPVGTTSRGFGSGELFTVGSTFTYEFTPTLLGFVQYFFTNRDLGTITGGSATQNLLIFGLRQSF